MSCKIIVISFDPLAVQYIIKGRFTQWYASLNRSSGLLFPTVSSSCCGRKAFFFLLHPCSGNHMLCSLYPSLCLLLLPLFLARPRRKWEEDGRWLHRDQWNIQRVQHKHQQWIQSSRVEAFNALYPNLSSKVSNDFEKCFPSMFLFRMLKVVMATFFSLFSSNDS